MQYINGCWNVGTLENKVPKKVLFSLMARPLTPLVMARLFREELFLRFPFFCGGNSQFLFILNLTKV